MSKEVNPVSENIWQRISDTTGSVVTPSNIIDSISLAGSKYAIDHLDEWRGIGLSAATFLSDLVDGKIARATGTTSPLGEKIDAAGDKFKMAYAIYKSYEMNLAPKSLLGAVALRNGANALLTTVDQAKNGQDHKLHSSKLGKWSIFAEQAGVGLHIIAARLRKDGSAHAGKLETAANIIGWGGVALGAAATYGYAKTLLEPTETASNS